MSEPASSQLLESKHFVSVQYYEWVMSHEYSISKCVDAGKPRKSQMFSLKEKQALKNCWALNKPMFSAMHDKTMEGW